MERGYVKVWRKMLDCGLLQKPHALQVFMYCLLKATHKPFKAIVDNKQVELQPGQLIAGRDKLALALNLSPQNIRTALNSLRLCEILTINSTKRYSIISINNWASYQAENVETNQDSNQDLTKTQPSPNHIQEHKNISLSTNVLMSSPEATTDSREQNNPVIDLEALPTKDDGSICPQKAIVSLYHEVLPELPRVKKWRSNHSRALCARWREKLKEGKFIDTKSGLDYFGRFFNYIRQSDFLMGKVEGRAGHAFTCKLGWIVTASHFDDIVDGKYHRRPN